MGCLKRNIVPIALLLVLLLVTGLVVVSELEEEIDFAASNMSSCNVSVLSVTGSLDTQDTGYGVNSLDIAQELRAFSTDDRMAVVLLVDSPGGVVPAAEEIADAVHSLDKPSVSFVRGEALSAAYWVSSATDYIVALPSSLIGNIGVTSSYLDELTLNEQEGYGYQEIVSGEYKEVGNVNKPLTPEHRAYLQSRVDALFTLFRQAVQQNRGLTDEEFALVADAKFYVAGEAYALGLVDEIGGIDEVKKYLEEVLGVDSDTLLLCEPVEIGVQE